MGDVGSHLINLAQFLVGPIAELAADTRTVITELEHRVDVNTLRHERAARLELNEIGRVRMRCSAPLMVDPYSRNRTTGSFILIDEESNDTVGAGMVIHASSS